MWEAGKAPAEDRARQRRRRRWEKSARFALVAQSQELAMAQQIVSRMAAIIALASSSKSDLLRMNCRTVAM